MHIGQRKHTLLRFTSVIPLVAAAMIGQTASAQETEEAAESGLNVIVVTAQKREQNVQDVPLAVSVTTGEDLERLQVNNIESLQFSTPSLVVAGQDPSRKTFGIRGISDQSRNAGFDNRIGVYVDGVWVGRSAASNQAVLDVASIEVLRGPQGTLFGKNTVAGAINIITAKPEFGTSGYVEAEYGNYDNRRLKGMLNVAASDNVAMRVSGMIHKRDGFVQNLFNGLDYDNRDDYGLRGQLLIEQGDTSLYITADTAQFKSRGAVTGELIIDPRAPNPREFAIDELQNYKIGVDGLSAQVDHEFGNGGTLTSITAFRTSSYFVEGNDEDNTPFAFAFTKPAFEDTSHFSQEIRYASDDSGRFDYVVGLYYLTQDIQGGGTATAFAPAINPLAPPVFVSVNQFGTVKSQSYAIFAHTNFDITDRLELTAGARFNKEDKSVDYKITDTSGLFTNGALKDKRSSSDFSPTVSLNYDVTDDVMTYVRYARAYKSGGWNTDFVPSVPDIGFDDESVDAFEVGLKSLLFDRRLRLNLSAYLSKHSDFQVFAFTQLSNGGSAINVTNAGKVTSKGFEVEADVQPVKWLNLFFNYGYNDTKFDSFKNGGGPGVDFDGNRPAEAPKHNLNLGIATDFDLGFANLMIQGDYNYRSSFFSNPNNLPINLNSSLEQVNLRAGLDFGNVSVFGWMRNAFDVTTQIYNRRTFLGASKASYNSPQTYGVTVKVEFGK
ncbi:TonB-dependent receptor [Parasphingorhabdus halotolerans]|uniref:TonB-dependent receptor n=1 Tax=Parasphingorhabdus halotolerans TaxID=2725558 RepID=A0A6H2DHV0_9SPHN|nr:TonB-dependent receptor [Parasphingorhabdus halotolerans]QJB68249.1 TonB-dependent receptor [Parasphingorhabdus halotolerans]